MEKEFVPYAESLELKQLGFDEPCFATYEFEKLFIGEFLNSMSFELCEKTEVFPAPTYSQCFRWFREKYQASPSIHCMSEQGNSWRYHIPNEGGERDFLTYEEAELACLRKLIEIVKNQ